MLVLCAYLPISTWRLNGIVTSCRGPARVSVVFQGHICVLDLINKLEVNHASSSQRRKLTQQQDRHPETYLAKRADDVAIL